MMRFTNQPSQLSLFANLLLPIAAFVVQMIARRSDLIWFIAFLPLTALAAGWAALIWIAHFEKALAGRLLGQWFFMPLMRKICEIEGISPGELPGGHGKPIPLTVQLVTDEDWTRACAQLKAEFWYQDEAIEELVRAVRHAVELRSGRVAAGPAPPIGVHLLVGKEGLAKRGIARRLGALVFGGDRHVLDLAEYEPEGHAVDFLAGAATGRMGGVVVLDHLERCGPAFRDRLLKIAKGEQAGLQTGINAGAFASWLIFGLVHVDAAAIVDKSSDDPVVATRTGFPPAFTALASVTPFVVPARHLLKFVIGKILIDQCRASGMRLVRADEALVAETCLRAWTEGGLAGTAPTLGRLAKNAMIAAREGRADRITVDPAPMSVETSTNQSEDEGTRMSQDQAYPDLDAMLDWDLVDVLLSEEDSKKKQFDEQGFIRDLKREIAGQDHVIEEMAQIIRKQKAAKERSKPIARFMLFGPSGTGKTQIAKAAARSVFGTEYVEVDFAVLGNKSEQEVVTELFGQNPGYHGDIGLFARELGAIPDRLVLFDEIEKAKTKPGVFSSLLKILDEGYSVDIRSRQRVDWSRSIIFMTGNLNSLSDQMLKIQDTIADPKLRQRALKDLLINNGTFAPEFLARIDCILMFRPIDARSLSRVIALKMWHLGVQHNFNIRKIDPKAIVYLTKVISPLAEKGGVRVVMSTISDEIEALLEDASRTHHRQEADVEVSYDDGRWLLRPMPEQADHSFETAEAPAETAELSAPSSRPAKRARRRAEDEAGPR